MRKLRKLTREECEVRATIEWLQSRINWRTDPWIREQLVRLEEQIAKPQRQERLH